MIRTDGKRTIANAEPRGLTPYSAQAKIVTTRERELERQLIRLQAENASLRRQLERVL